LASVPKVVGVFFVSCSKTLWTSSFK